MKAEPAAAPPPLPPIDGQPGGDRRGNDGLLFCVTVQHPGQAAFLLPATRAQTPVRSSPGPTPSGSGWVNIRP